ncbi:MAG: DEAD/DEAH box helicase [Rickettsiales bacterium]
MKFTELKLPKEINASLEKLNFEEMTPIQEKAIPLALEGKDILGSAQTGTGKTAAFAIPLIAKLMANKESNAIVLAPTRELANQVMQTVQSLLPPELYRETILLIGGAPMPKQLKRLRSFPRIVVGTPGRINDHLKRKSLILKKTDFLVLDETDRMLDMGFSIQIDEIVKHMPEVRQTLLFSATLPKNILKVADKYLINPERIAVGGDSKPVEKIKQDFVHLNTDEKYDHLINQLETRTGSVIIFAATKIWAKKIADKLSRDNHRADAIHGDLRHSKREQVLAAFRRSKFRVLVATDVAARGLDIPHIEHVINYDLPQCAEDYVHRIGRTARNDAEGSALSYISPADKSKYMMIHRLINPDAKLPEMKAANSNRRNRNKGKGGFRAGKSEGKFGKPNSGKRNFGEKSDSFSRDGKPSFEKREGGFDRKKRFGEKERFGERSEFSRDGRKPSKFGGKRKFGEKPEFSSDNRKSSSFGGKRKFSEKSEFSADSKKPIKFGGKNKFAAAAKSEGKPAKKSFFKKGWLGKLTGGKKKKVS